MPAIQKLPRILALTLLLSVLTTLSVSGYVLNWVLGQHITQQAENAALQLAEWMSKRELAPYIVQGPDQPHFTLKFREQDMPQIDQALRTTLGLLDILKIKIFSIEGRVLYSTDPSVIGNWDSDNPALRIALSGTPVSELELKERVIDAKWESRFDVDVVETYVPVLAPNGDTVGVFEIYQDATHAYRQIFSSTLIAVSVLACTLLLALGIAYAAVRKASHELEVSQSQLARLASRDFLTGLYNHREITRMAKSCFAEFHRDLRDQGGAAFSLIMLDLDDFKNINDSHGHLVGDQVLKGFASQLETQLREYTLIGRYGGEEFLVLLPNTPFQDARAIADRLCQRISAEPIATEQAVIPISASLGVSTAVRNDQGINQLIQRADDALYEAKRAGKNTVRFC